MGGCLVRSGLDGSPAGGVTFVPALVVIGPWPVVARLPVDAVHIILPGLRVQVLQQLLHRVEGGDRLVQSGDSVQRAVRDGGGGCRRALCRRQGVINRTNRRDTDRNVNGRAAERNCTVEGIVHGI